MDTVVDFWIMFSGRKMALISEENSDISDFEGFTEEDLAKKNDPDYVDNKWVNTSINEMRACNLYPLTPNMTFTGFYCFPHLILNSILPTATNSEYNLKL